jgi:hypothetical protein
MAAKDMPIKTKTYSWERVSYKRSLYMLCNIQKDMLIVAFFLPEFLRAGERQPSYELFIHRESKAIVFIVDNADMKQLVKDSVPSSLYVRVDLCKEEGLRRAG